jgi:hypothetical protein
MKHCEVRALWRSRLSDQKTSGLSINAWCWANGIRHTVFYRWREKINRYDSIGEVSIVDNSSGKIVPAKPAVKAESEWILLNEFPDDDCDTLNLKIGKISIELRSGFDRQLLKDVLHTLEVMP